MPGAIPEAVQRQAERRIGQVVDGKYRIKSIIGLGGMGIVYEAEHQFVGRPVALKILHPRYADRLEEFRRFLHEARTIGAVGHRCVVEVYDAGAADGTTPYLAMELLVGENLDQRIRRTGPLSARRAFRVAREVLKGLEVAHRKGVVHCDLKPANVFLVRGHTRRGFIKLLDFGVSRMERGDDPADTASGSVFGTPHYMAPEQVSAGALDARTDLYAVGAVIVESLTGKPPFVGHSRAEVFWKILHEPVPAVLTARDDLPPELARLVRRLLSRDPSDRFQSAAEVVAAIDASGLAGDDDDGSGRPAASPPSSPPPGNGRTPG
jgi:serine/threonine-protein kinase